MDNQQKRCPKCAASIGKSNERMWHEEGEDCTQQKAPVGRGGIRIGTQEEYVEKINSGQSDTMKDAIERLRNSKQ